MTVTTTTRIRPDADVTSKGAFFKANTPYAAISVTDTGIGMNQTALEYVFEAFRQVDGTATRKVGGTGLGLAITKSMTTMLGGRVNVESEEGVGTTFTITIPCTLGDGAVGSHDEPVVGPSEGQRHANHSRS